MKNLQKQQALLKKGLFFLSTLFLLFVFAGCRKVYQNPAPKIKTVISGLQAPMGMETLGNGRVLVAEAGTAHNDGKVVLVTDSKNGSKMYDVVTHLSSIINALSHEVEGPSHLLLDHQKLYILSAEYLYTIDLKQYKPGDAPIDASTMPYEDIGAWVRSQNIVTPNDSHPYNLIKGPDDLLYIVDAGANAIIQRKATGQYRVFATFPDLKNPTQMGPPMMQSVPTGILFDGHQFLVSTLTGFPFPAGQAVIYQVSMTGQVSVQSGGYSTLVDLAPGNFYGHVALSYGAFGQGWTPNSGSMFFITPHAKRNIADGLNMPSALAQIDGQSWYVTSMGDGTLLKVSYGY